MTTTPTVMPSAGAPMDQERANQQLRQAILDKKQAQIDAWSARIEQMQESIQTVADNVRGESEQRLADLRQARDQARNQLDNLRQASQERWESLLQQSDSFFQDLSSRFHEFVLNQSSTS